MEAGEQSKSLLEVEKIWGWLISMNARRTESIAIIGGGTILDAGAFAASCYQRGIRFSLIPTTLLAMVDASIGGKNGVNFNLYKNYIGNITQPQYIITDYSFLKSLPKEEMMNGWMEMAKHALIADPKLWLQLSSHEEIPSTEDLTPLIEQAAGIKKNIVAIDPSEMGLRATLNFGHTLGHALESLAITRKESLPHGFAVGLGMIFSLHWSANKLKQTSTEKREEPLIKAASLIKSWLDFHPSLSWKKWTNTVKHHDAWNYMLKDKKNSQSEVLEIQLKDVGESIWNVPMPFNEFESAWNDAFVDPIQKNN